MDSCIICQGPFSVLKVPGVQGLVSTIKGPVRQQAPSPLTVEHCAEELVLVFLHTCTFYITTSVISSLLCSVCLNCQSMHVGD